MIKQKYVPLIKTTDAELRGYSELAMDVKDQLLPLFELTKSRKTKLEPYGNVEKRMLKIKNVLGDRPFILDLTTHPDMDNYQIKDLLDKHDGFKCWREFLESHSDYKIIPVVHVNPDELEETTKLVRWLDSRYEKFVFKAESSDGELPSYLDSIVAGCSDVNKLLIIIDAQFVENDNFHAKCAGSIARANEANDLYGIKNIVIASSSFPRSVYNHTSDCRDSEGSFARFDEKLVAAVTSSTDVNIIYGDYASIHPARYQVGGGTWVPRIDYPLENSYIYTRYRRNVGGYIKAAEEMVLNSMFTALDCWGYDEIKASAEGEPNGLSPSYWIAVRLNLHITEKVKRTPL